MKIDKKEVLRYLGYKKGKIEEKMDNLIEESIDEMEKVSKPRYIYRVFDLNKEENDIELLKSTLVFKGKDINNHLKDSTKCALLAVTLGTEVDQKIRYYEKFNLTKSVILDACATAAVESACDLVEKEIEKKAKQLGFGITYRYSPGYGDFKIDIQKDIIRCLDLQKNIGLTVTENYILLPRKSVTAVIGFQNNAIKRIHPGCKECKNYKTCNFRRDGNYCGN